MAIQRDDTEERQARLDALIEQFRVEKKRALLNRGIALWTRTETRQPIFRRVRSLPPSQIN
jgi:hypothetical protein